MNQIQINRKVKKMVFNQLDKILHTFKYQKKQFSVERLPLKVVNEIIDGCKVNLKPDVDQFELFSKNFNKTLEALKVECKTRSEIIGDSAISYSEVSLFVVTIKESFKEGQKQKANL